MKRLFLFTTVLILMVFAIPNVVKAQNPFNPALIIEAKDTSGQCHDVLLGGLPAHANAYSHGNMLVNGAICDLYVYCWDSGPFLYPNYGFAVRQYIAGTPINSSTLPMYEDYRTPSTASPQGASASAASIDAVILEENGEPYILVCYYDYYMSHQYFIELYKWTGMGGLVLQVGPQPVSVSSGSAFDWINLDAYNLNNFMLTWCEGGKIYAKAGTMASGFNMGNTVRLDNSIYGIDAGLQTDVALTNVGGSSLATHFVYTNTNKKKLLVTTLPFNTIYTATPSAVMIPTLEDLRVTPGLFKVPRIDAPDNYPENDWSYVVADHRQGRDNIFTGLHHAGNSLHFNLNDGTFLPAPPIASSPNHTNDIPVIAYERSGNDLYYCWYYKSSTQPLSPSVKGYIGLKITNTGTQIGLNNKYWIVQDAAQHTSGQPAIALSTQNDASPELFLAFLQTENLVTLGYTGIKTVPWNHFPFRPNPSTGITHLDNNSAFYPAPNPFQETFKIISKDNYSDICSLVITDLTGREIIKLNGSLKYINQKLKAESPNLLPAIYFGAIRNNQGESMDFKIVKIK